MWDFNIDVLHALNCEACGVFTYGQNFAGFHPDYHDAKVWQVHMVALHARAITSGRCYCDTNQVL